MCLYIFIEYSIKLDKSSTLLLNKILSYENIWYDITVYFFVGYTIFLLIEKPISFINSAQT